MAIATEVFADENRVVEREMTADELAVYNADKAAHEANVAEIQKKTADREALLTKLGITAEEAVLLLS